MGLEAVDIDITGAANCSVNLISQTQFFITRIGRFRQSPQELSLSRNGIGSGRVKIVWFEFRVDVDVAIVAEGIQQHAVPIAWRPQHNRWVAWDQFKECRDRRRGRERIDIPGKRRCHVVEAKQLSQIGIVKRRKRDGVDRTSHGEGNCSRLDIGQQVSILICGETGIGRVHQIGTGQINSTLRKTYPFQVVNGKRSKISIARRAN